MSTKVTKMRVLISDALRFRRRSVARTQVEMGKGRDQIKLMRDPAPTVGSPSRRRRTKRPSSVGGPFGVEKRGLRDGALE